MSVLTAKQYTLILLLQYILLLFDICINSFCSFARPYPVDLLVLYIVQDVCLIVALTVLLVSFFSTYIFQVGLIQLLYARFRVTLVLCIFYIFMSIGLHAWHVTVHWSSPLSHYWSKSFHALHAIHRIIIYYYFYKRAALRISDPRFYEGSSWVQKQLSLS